MRMEAASVPEYGNRVQLVEPEKFSNAESGFVKIWRGTFVNFECYDDWKQLPK